MQELWLLQLSCLRHLEGDVSRLVRSNENLFWLMKNAIKLMHNAR